MFMCNFLRLLHIYIDNTLAMFIQLLEEKHSI